MFDRLLKEVVRRKIDFVAAWSVDRLGRSSQDLVGFLGELNAAGVRPLSRKSRRSTRDHPGRPGAVPDARCIPASGFTGLITH
jgi:hypothetical protein